MKNLFLSLLITCAAFLFILLSAVPVYGQGTGEPTPEPASAETVEPETPAPVEGPAGIEGETEGVESGEDTVEVRIGGEQGKTIAGEDYTVEEAEVIDGDIEVTGGDLTVRGIVNGDASVVGGDLYIYGTIAGDAVDVGGDIHIKEGGTLDGDAVNIGGSTYVDEGATFTGKEVRIGDDIDIDLPGPIFKGFEFAENPMVNPILDAVKALFFFLFMVFVGLLIVIFMPRQAGNISEHMLQEFPRSSLLGLALLVASPIVIVVLAVTIIGIPIAMLYVVAIILLGILAFVIFSKIIGGKIIGENRHGMLQVLVGVLIFYSPILIGTGITIIPVELVAQIGEIIVNVGKFVFLTAAVLGAGAILYSRFGTWELARTRAVKEVTAAKKPAEPKKQEPPKEITEKK